jgi:DNA-directed RNA polymerase subunit RPC12/RpoP
MKKPTEKHGFLGGLFEPKPKSDASENRAPEPVLQPALRQIGVTDCPVCKHEVAVFLTKNSRPFINCSFCSARIFYNGREAMRRLKRKMVTVDS